MWYNIAQKNTSSAVSVYSCYSEFSIFLQSQCKQLCHADRKSAENYGGLCGIRARTESTLMGRFIT